MAEWFHLEKVNNLMKYANTPVLEIDNSCIILPPILTEMSTAGS